MNVDPFEKLEGGFFATDWDFKVWNVLITLQPAHVACLSTLSSKSCDNSSSCNYLMLLISSPLLIAAGAFSTTSIRKIKLFSLLWTQMIRRVEINSPCCPLVKTLNENATGWQMVRAQSLSFLLLFPACLFIYICPWDSLISVFLLFNGPESCCLIFVHPVKLT